MSGLVRNEIFLFYVSCGRSMLSLNYREESLAEPDPLSRNEDFANSAFSNSSLAMSLVLASTTFAFFSAASIGGLIPDACCGFRATSVGLLEPDECGFPGTL